MERVTARYGLEPERVLRRSTDPRVSDARGLVCYIGVDVLGLKATEVGRVLGLLADRARAGAWRVGGGWRRRSRRCFGTFWTETR